MQEIHRKVEYGNVEVAGWVCRNKERHMNRIDLGLGEEPL